MYFYGLGECAEVALINIKNVEQQNLIEAVIDSNKKGIWNGYNIVELNSLSKNEIIVITVKIPQLIKDIKDELKKNGFNNIYYFNGRKTYTDFLKDSCTFIKEWGDAVIPQVEMHISDYCNLNCKGCTHYSALFEKKLPDYNEQIKDIIKLKNKCSHIIRFYILGGEPFLNPNIKEYLNALVQILPETDVWIVTNGLLIMSLPEDVLRLISDLKVVVSISEYEPTHKVIDKIKNKLDKYNISYDIRKYERKQKFIKPLSLSDNSIYNNICISDGCVNIWHGKIARCPSLMYIDKLNSYFGVSFPNEGIMNLDDCPNDAELVRALNQKVPLCKHCVDNKMEWKQCDMNNIKLEDFVTEL